MKNLPRYGEVHKKYMEQGGWSALNPIEAFIFNNFIEDGEEEGQFLEELQSALEYQTTSLESRLKEARETIEGLREGIEKIHLDAKVSGNHVLQVRCRKLLNQK